MASVAHLGWQAVPAGDLLAAATGPAGTRRALAGSGWPPPRRDEPAGGSRDQPAAGRRRDGALTSRCRLSLTGTLSRVSSAEGRGKPWIRRLLGCGLVAGPVFVSVFLAEGAARDGYRPLRHPVSSLALGPRAWVQAGNFVVTGTLFLAGAAGLSRAGGPEASRAGAAPLAPRAPG